MQAVCLVTGLLGTLAMPRLERLVGLERAGAWSIWYVNSLSMIPCGERYCKRETDVIRFEVVCLTPVLLAFFYGTGQYGEHGQTWNSVLLFGGIALSRIGLWSFDLCQVSLNPSTPTYKHRVRYGISPANVIDLGEVELT